MDAKSFEGARPPVAASVNPALTPNRRRLALGVLAAAPLAGCGKLGELGKSAQNNAGKPWSYARTGRQERFEIRAGDHWKGEHSERSEIAVYRFVKTNTDVWQAYSLLIEPGPTSLAPWCIFGQWHAYKDPWDEYVSPPVAQFLSGDTFKLWTASDPSLRETIRNYPRPVIRYQRPHFERGRWHNFVHRTRFSAFGQGELQCWIDGQIVIDLKPIPIGYNDMIGPYFKYGVYRPPGDPAPMAARYANMELGYQSLAHRILEPLPV